MVICSDCDDSDSGLDIAYDIDLDSRSRHPIAFHIKAIHDGVF